LNDWALDGRKPSVFVRQMKSKMDDIGLKASDDILKARLVKAMPSNAQLVLTGQQSLPLENFVAIADSLMEVWDNQTTVAHLSSQSKHNSQPVPQHRGRGDSHSRDRKFEP